MAVLEPTLDIRWDWKTTVFLSLSVQVTFQGAKTVKFQVGTLLGPHEPLPYTWLVLALFETISCRKSIIHKSQEILVLFRNMFADSLPAQDQPQKKKSLLAVFTATPPDSKYNKMPKDVPKMQAKQIQTQRMRGDQSGPKMQ